MLRLQVGGFDGESYLSSAERLDPRVGRCLLLCAYASWSVVLAPSALTRLIPPCRWEKLPAHMAVKRGSLACCACDGLVYAVGGALCFSSPTHVPLLVDKLLVCYCTHMG